MKFDPKTEQELKTINLLADGEANYQVIKAEEKYNEKLHCEIFDIVFKVWDKNGKEGILSKALFNNEKGQKEIFEYCASAGHLNYYEKGELLPHEEVGATGKFNIITADDKNNVKRNYIKNFIPAPKVVDFEDDDIPM